MNGKPTWKSTMHALVYLLPAFLIIGVFCAYPIVYSFDISLYVDYNYYKNIVFARGMANYIEVLHDPEFWRGLKHTAIITAVVVPVSVLVSLLVAVGIHTRVRIGRYVQTAYFLPLVTSAAAVSMAWRWIFHSEYGVLNSLLGSVGLSPVGWLTKPEWALPSVILFCVWRSLGYNVILMLVGLQAIHPQYGKAARMDGAPGWERFRHITLPLLSPTIAYVTVVSTIHAFKVFDEIYVLYGGRPGPLNSAMTAVFYVFRKFYGESEYGVASAAAYLLFVIVFALTLIQLRAGRNRVQYYL